MSTIACSKVCCLSTNNDCMYKSILLTLFLVFGVIYNQNVQAANYFYQTDHLDTPKVVTDQFQRVVWREELRPFGGENPSTSLNKLKNNLRFPGQYFDAESGLHYNYFRDYNPNDGRYMQSDPIGLAAGPNTYSYALNNPYVFIDPLGLLNFFVEGFVGGAAGSGAEGSIGAVFTFNDPNTGELFKPDSFASIEGAFGGDVSAGLNFGFFKGGNEDFSGVTDNISVTLFGIVITGKFEEGTQLNECGIDTLRGGSLGIAPLGLPFGATVSKEGTVTITNLRKFIFGD